MHTSAFGNSIKDNKTDICDARDGKMKVKYIWIY